LIPEIEPVVDKRRAGSISTLRTPEGAVWAAIVVVLLVVIGPVVVVEREGRRWGEGVVVGGGRQEKPKACR